MSEIPPEVALGVNMLGRYKGTDWNWHYNPVDGNYDADANLSAALITVEGATGSSPTHILLFHRGVFRGQGTPVAGAFVSLVHDECTDDTVVVQFKIPGEYHAGPPKSLHRVEYTSRDGTIYWSGDWPFGDDQPPPGWLVAQGP